jgi:hypothetical protein
MGRMRRGIAFGEACKTFEEINREVDERIPEEGDPGLPPTEGARMCAWIERHCLLGEGDHYGRPFRLRPFQRRFIYRLYDLKAEGTRGRALLGLPKGNGKTTRLRRVYAVACVPSRWQRSLAVLLDEGLPMVEWPSHSVGRMVSACAQFYDGVTTGRVSTTATPDWPTMSRTPYSRSTGGGRVSPRCTGRSGVTSTWPWPRSWPTTWPTLVSHSSAAFTKSATSSCYSRGPTDVRSDNRPPARNRVAASLAQGTKSIAGIGGVEPATPSDRYEILSPGTLRTGTLLAYSWHSSKRRSGT